MSGKSILCLINLFSIFVVVSYCSYDVEGPTTALTCKPNEVLNLCPRYCTFDKTCEEWLYGYIRDCPTPPPTYPCIPTCFCLPNYLRINGTCRPQSECCSDPNEEVVTCPNPCPGGTCDQPEFSPCRKACFPRGCQCKSGYVRDTNNKCIPLSQCRSSETNCSLNEVWNACPLFTTDETCESILFSGKPREYVKNPPGEKCKGRCECLKGFVRVNDECLPHSVCCPRKNTELVRCPNPCPGGTCNSPIFLPCDKVCKPWGCQCKKGYVRDKNRNCVLLSECNESCKANEVWNDCPQYCSFDMSCERYLFDIIRDCPPPPPGWRCTGRCDCAPGLVRINDSCHLPSACCSDPNTSIVDCPNPCPGGTCKQPFFSNCNLFCWPKGCICKKGYVKNENNTCVPASSCEPLLKCKENEKYNHCPNECDPELSCDEYIRGVAPPSCNIFTPPTPAAYCSKPRCDCIKPYARNRDGVCVHTDKCT